MLGTPDRGPAGPWEVAGDRAVEGRDQLAAAQVHRLEGRHLVAAARLEMMQKYKNFYLVVKTPSPLAYTMQYT